MAGTSTYPIDPCASVVAKCQGGYWMGIFLLVTNTGCDQQDYFGSLGGRIRHIPVLALVLFSIYAMNIREGKVTSVVGNPCIPDQLCVNILLLLVEHLSNFAGLIEAIVSADDVTNTQEVEVVL
jgi:hypothetical protein